MGVNEKWLHCKINNFTIYNLPIPFLTTSAKKISEKILCYNTHQTSNRQTVKTSNYCLKHGGYFQSTQPIVLSDYYATSQQANALRLRNSRQNYHCQISPATNFGKHRVFNSGGSMTAGRLACACETGKVI